MYGQEVQSHALVAVESSVYHAVVVEADVEDVACSWWLFATISSRKKIVHIDSM